jgi:CRP-like cAMP-binding protein
MSMTTDQLSRVPIFKDVPKKSLERLARIARERKFAAGEVILKEGDEGVGFFLVTSGNVDVTRGGAKLTTLGPNDFFGEMALLDNHRRSATVTASGPVSTYAMLRSDFVAELESSSELAIHLLSAMSRRLRDTDARLAEYER